MENNLNEHIKKYINIMGGEILDDTLFINSDNANPLHALGIPFKTLVNVLNISYVFNYVLNDGNNPSRFALVKIDKEKMKENHFFDVNTGRENGNNEFWIGNYNVKPNLIHEAHHERLLNHFFYKILKRPKTVIRF